MVSSSIESDSGNSTLKFDSGRFPVRPKESGIQYANFMIHMYNKVAAVCLLNVTGAQIPKGLGRNDCYS